MKTQREYYSEQVAAKEKVAAAVKGMKDEDAKRLSELPPLVALELIERGAGKDAKKGKKD